MEKINSKKSKKNRYNYNFSIVKGVIDKLDPIGLLNQDAPQDEYNEEISRIISGLQKCNKIEEVQELIYNIFRESFGEKTTGNISHYWEVAKSIFENIRR